MQYTIPVVIVLLVFVGVLFVFRKNHHTEISRLDQKKIDIQNKPVLEELSKVKGLNMGGQTEEMFERWRNKWMELIDVELIKVDELIFQVEEHVDKFQFKKASVLEVEIDKQLTQYDEEMNAILKELDDLMESEQKNRVEIEQLQENYRSSRKTLLAHQYAFGGAGQLLEERLETFPSRFEEYDQLTREGNYLQAQEVVTSIDEDGQTIFQLIQEIPKLLQELQHKIPSDIQDLRMGHREMEGQSYYLLHLEIPEKLDAMEEKLPLLKEQVTNLDTTDAITQVETMKLEIEACYEVLEVEVIAKQYVDANFTEIGVYLHTLIQDVEMLKIEADKVKKIYHLSDEHMATPIASRGQLNSIKQRYDILATEVREQQSAYSSIHEELLDIQKLMDKEEENRVVFANFMKDLRVHEHKGRDEQSALQKRLHEVERKLHKANTPGIPEEITARLKEAENQLHVIGEGLNEVPIDMETIALDIEKGTKYVGDLEKVMEEMLENVQLTELLIQYGNRYRTVKPGMDEQLEEAEHAFRNLRFSKALEIVATAVETAEPGALKKIQSLAKDTMASS